MRVPILVGLLTVMIGFASLGAADPLLVNGAFFGRDAQGGLPGWTTSVSGVQVVEEAGKPILVLRTTGGETAWATQTLKLDPTWSALRFRYRVRVASVVPGTEVWHTPRIALTFLAGEGTPVHAVAGMWKAPQPVWQELDLEVAVPAGSDRVHVTPATFSAAAEWALANLRIDVVGPHL